MSRTFPFFATECEVIELWQTIAGLPGMRLLEGSSRPDQPLRQFECFPVEEWSDPNHFTSVVAWPSDISSTPAETRIVFNEEGRQWSGGKGRTSLTSPAFLRIAHINAPNSNLIGFNELIFESLASTRGRFSEEQIAGVDWHAIGNLIRDIKKGIQKSAAGKWRSIPVSKGVAEILRNGDNRLWFWGNEGSL